jgi:hypothetical protein
MEPSNPRFTPEEIAEAALSYWDMFAEDTADEVELNGMVTEELVSWGLAEGEAERVVKMTSAALADSAGGGGVSGQPHGFRGDPIYAALLTFIRTRMDL